MTSKTPAITAQPILQQQYSYDQLNRITASNTPGAGNKYRTGYSYDANGNIKTLARYDASSTRFDTLVYNYETKASGYLRTTNRLRWVDDDALLSGLQQTDVDDQSTDNYSYDAIGNLTKDNQEEIAKIEWTVAGKVKRVLRTESSTKPALEFEYDASGHRIVKKVLKKNGEITSTYYLRDASGNVMSIYSYNANSDNDPALTEQYLYGSSRIGVYTPTANVLSKTRVIGRKSYELSDHLGNVRATLSDYRRLASQAQVQSATDYYPFGMVARMYTSSQQYRYGFNGKEKEGDAGSFDYDFGARMYDSRLGRWLAVDPAFKEFVSMSPYCGLGNNPQYFIDKDGEKIVVPDPDDRAVVLKMINAKALGTYAFNAQGELYQVKATGDATRYSKYYADKLNAAINDEQTIEIRVRKTVGTSTVEGNKIIHHDATDDDSKDIDVDAGGGLTRKLARGGGDNVLVYISGNENTYIKDESGKPLEDKAADILAHELVGHAIPAILGTDTGNAVENENKVRAEVKKEGQVEASPLRAAETDHTE
jgi:RHS repeat-associated protein